ncbi:MAG: type IV pilus modification protein PilV [Granulosicoccus sp.]
MNTSSLFDKNVSGKSTQNGIGLIEILIAVLLISVGFLAAARMQVEGMRFSQSAYYQSQAYFLASDMIDRMRSNVRGVADGFYFDQETAADAENPQCGVNACQAQAIARQDIYDWSAALHPMTTGSGFVAALPGTSTKPAKGSIENVGNGVIAVIMSWNEVIGGSDSEQTFRIQFAMEENQ